MTHYLLNYLDVSFIFAKSCAKRMAKNAATEMRDDNGFSVFFLNFCSSSLLHHLVIVSIAQLPLGSVACLPHLKDKSSFLRHLIIYGYVYGIDYSELREYNAALTKIGNNLKVSYKEAHQIGVELADKLLEGKYSYVVTTHIDKGHVHNHIIFCAADNINHEKYHDCKRPITTSAHRSG